MPPHFARIPPGRRPIGRRRGFLLPAAFVIGFVILGLAGVYYYAAITQNTRGHRFRGSVSGLFLTRGAVEYMRHLVRDAADPSEAFDDSLDPTRSFRHLARAAPSELAGALRKARGLTGGGDDRRLIERLFGPGAATPIDRLEATIPGAELRVFLDVEATPFPGAVAGYRDVVAKGLTVILRATADIAGAESQAEGTEAVVVYPLNAPLVSKFTGNIGYQWHEPGRAFPVEAFDPRAPPRPLLQNGPGDPAGLMARYIDKGWVYPREQMMDPGSEPYQLDYLLWRPENGFLPRPRSLLFENLPDAFSTAVATPGDPTINQRPLMEGIVVGLLGTDEETIPGFPYPFASDPLALSFDGETRSGLELFSGQGGPFGTSRVPSPTFAPGSRATVYGITAVTVDRDETRDDEGRQRREAGVELPYREGVGYLLTQCPQAAGEYRREVGTQLRNRQDSALPRILSDRLENRNVRVDTDGDGVPDRDVPSERQASQCVAGVCTFPVFPQAYDPARLLPEADDYARFASREVQFPLNQVHELAPMKVEESQKRLHELAWGRGEIERTAAWSAEPYGLAHRDPLRAGGDLPEPERLHWGVTAAEARAAGDDPEFVAQVRVAAGFAATRWRPTVRVWGQEMFEKYFPGGDLRGFFVVIEAPAEDAASVLRLPSTLRGGAVSAGLAVEKAAVADQPVEAPVEVYAPTVVLGEGGGSTLTLFTERIFPRFFRSTGQARLRGGAFSGVTQTRFGYLGTPQALEDARHEAIKDSFPVPLVTVYDADRDPIGPEAHRAYRVAWAGL